MKILSIDKYSKQMQLTTTSRNRPITNNGNQTKKLQILAFPHFSIVQSSGSTSVNEKILWQLTSQQLQQHLEHNVCELETFGASTVGGSMLG
jgi:hypothetical protein